MQQTISLCQACQPIFTGNLEEKICPYSYDFRPEKVFRHHLSTSSYLAIRHCYICYICYTAWTSAENSDHTEHKINASNVPGTWFSIETNGTSFLLRIWPMEPVASNPRRRETFYLSPVEGGCSLQYLLSFCNPDISSFVRNTT